MGVIQVPGRLSGKTYSVKIKGDTPSDTEQARIRAYLDEQENSYVQNFSQRFGFEPPTPDDGTALGRGLEVGKPGAYSRLGTATEYLGSGLGLESLVGTGQRMRQEGDYEGFLESLRQPAPTTLEDVKAAEGILPTVGAGLTYIGEGIGQSIPEMAAPLAATAAGTVLGGPVAGLAAGAATAFPTFFGGDIQRRESVVGRENITSSDVQNALLAALGQSALNAVGDKLLLGGFLKPGQKWLTRTAIGAGEGAVAEVPTEIAQQMLERKQAGLPLDDDEAINEYVNAGILGGVMGGGIRGTTAGLGLGMEKAPTPLPQEEAPIAAAPAAPTRKPDLPALPAPGTLEPLGAAQTPDVVVTPPPPGAVRGSDTSNIPSLSPDATATARSIGGDAQMLSAVEAIEAAGKATTKVLQDALGLSYPAATGLMRKLEGAGAVSKYQQGKDRVLTLPFEVSAIRQAQATAAPVEALGEPTIKVKPTTVPKATVTEAPEVAVPSVNEAVAKADVLPVEPPAPVVVPKPKYRKAAEAAAAVAAPIQEVADVPEITAAEPSEMGAGIPSGGQGVEGGGRPDDIAAGSAGIEAPAGEGLGGRVPVSMGAPAAAGAEPSALTAPAFTGSPTELQVRDAERQLAPMLAVREVAANSAAQSELDAAWTARVADKPELASLIEEYSAPDALVLEDPTTSEDKRRVLDLFQPSAIKKGKAGMAPAENAQMYFSRFKRPIDALEFIVADATLGSQSFKDSKKLAAEVGTLPAGYETVNPVELEFFSGMTAERAKEALKWVEANMSPQAQVKVRDLQRKYKQAQEAKVPNKVLSSAPTSTAIGGRAANAEERQAMEQELVVQATEDAAKKAESKALAGAARTRMQGLENLLSAVQETKAPIPKRALPKTKLTAEDEIDLVTDKILGLRFNRPQEVLDLYTPLHPSVVNALRRGNLTTALRALQMYAPNERVKRIAGALFPYVEGTSVRLVDGLRDEATEVNLNGQYRRIDGTSEILLDSLYGMNVMTLLHEMTHAATVKELLNEASPMRKRMEKIFADVAPKLGTLNGQKDIFEFAADAFSDPQFQSELARLYPDGKPVSTFGRFLHEVTNFVRRLLGMPLKALGSALDVTDQMVMEILDYPINMTEFSSPQEEATLLNRVAQVDGSFPGRTKEFAQQFGDDTSRVLDGASYNAKRAVLGFLNSQSMADVAQYYGIAGARDLQNAIDQHDAASIKSDSEVDGVLQIAQKWVKNNPNLKPLFDRVVHQSTVNQVDPSLTRDKAIKKYGADSEKMGTYDTLQKNWAAIGKDGRDVYTNMRELYRKQYERLRAAISGKIDFILKDNPELAAEVKASIYTKFFDMNKIEPYFPLARSGDFWLEYSAFDPETGTTEPVRETYDSPNARSRAAKELESLPGITKGPDGKPITSFYTTLDLVQQGRTPDALFVRDTLSIVKNNLANTNVDAATTQSIQQELTKLFVDALPETSFAKSLQRRKNTRGYMEDSLEALKTKGYSLGRQGVRYAYSNKIRAIADAIAEQGKNIDNQSKSAVVAELVARANFATNPPSGMFERMVQTANRVAFTFTLGGNVSSALVNLSYVPVVLYAYLAGRYGSKSAATAIGNAYKLFMNSGLSREIELPSEFQGQKTTKVKAMPSIDNYFMLKEKLTKGADGKDVVTQEYVLRDDIAPELRPMLQELAPLVDVASKNGQLNRSIFYDSLGAEDVGRTRNFWDRFTAISGAAFHQVERANRQVALVAAYNLELARLRNKPTPAERSLSETEQRTRAAERAVYQATETGGGATLAAAPRWAQQGIGRTALMFKNFGLSLFYLQMKLLKQLTLGSNDPDFTPEDRMVAFKQLVGLQLTTFAFAGIAGMPLYGLVSTVANAFLGDDEEDADMLTRRYLGEGFYKGFLSNISGLDISSRIGLTGLLLRENRYNTDPSAEETIVANLGGPAWSTATQVGRGVSEFYKAMTGEEGDMVRGIENMVPAAVRNFIKAGRYMADGSSIETRRKDVITGDLGASDLLGQALGFTPMKATLEQDLNQLTVKISNAVSKKRANLSRLYYIALREGDIEGVQEVLKDIRAFNADIRGEFPKAMIDGEYLADSLKRHQGSSEKMVSGVSLNPAVREGLIDLRAQYNKGFQLF